MTKMARTDNFMPAPQGTIQVTATTSSAPYLIPEGGEDLMIGNQSTTIWCYIEMGNAGVTVAVPGQPWPGSAGGFPIPPNTRIPIRRLMGAFDGGPQSAAAWIAVIAASTTAVLTISAGNGS
jgi:hypothetical protein